ncbi:MAG: response regulator [Deltaproteobacteria bacterium]|nr:response regulator [Deltaproteobacteria bacterium]
MARKRFISPPSGYTILVVDDQEEVLLSTRPLLERYGHHVLTAVSGPEALALFRHHHVDLVITDYVMPGMNGETVVQALRALDAEVQILLQTGYSGEHSPQEMLQMLAIQGYHDKTEGPELLLQRINETLRGAARLHDKGDDPTGATSRGQPFSPGAFPWSHSWSAPAPQLAA